MSKNFDKRDSREIKAENTIEENEVVTGVVTREEELIGEPEVGELVDAEIQPPYIVFDCEKLNIRQGPGKSHSVVAVIPKGTLVFVDETYGEWAKVHTSITQEGYTIEGYVMHRYIKLV